MVSDSKFRLEVKIDGAWIPIAVEGPLSWEFNSREVAEETLRALLDDVEIEYNFGSINNVRVSAVA